jgi:hypothetical protein
MARPLITVIPEDASVAASSRASASPWGVAARVPTMATRGASNASGRSPSAIKTAGGSGIGSRIG